ncbi:hypothetical protein [Halomonas sp. A3H3]|uniref:hypothetical protein n=1 Tax=Halomonas sp. A3H3 TaxID=1346287 RepID=UPI0006B3E255|nr:hypothetical protein [Halomonas sp. A3H3]
MTVKIFDTPEVQDFVKTVAGFDQAGGNDRSVSPSHSSLFGDCHARALAIKARAFLFVLTLG